MKNKIEEISNIKSALNKISYDTWIFLDLDNTVMESRLDLGGDQWFTHLMEYIPKCDQSNIFILYYALQAHIRVQPSEPEIVLIIKALQDIGLPVFALTARDTKILPQTVRQLNDIGIDFSLNRSKLTQDDHYNSGVICCNGKNKGDALRQFLSNCSKKPQHIAMIDDKLHHLSHIGSAVASLKIKFSGFRYGGLDEKVTQFNIESANLQLAHLKNRLPKDVQLAIDALKLVPVTVDVCEYVSQFSHGFFPQKEPVTASSASGFPHEIGYGI